MPRPKRVSGAVAIKVATRGAESGMNREGEKERQIRESVVQGREHGGQLNRQNVAFAGNQEAIISDKIAPGRGCLEIGSGAARGKNRGRALAAGAAVPRVTENDRHCCPKN